MRTRGMLAVLFLSLPVAVQGQGVGRYYDYSGTITWKNRLDINTNNLKAFEADSVVVTVVKDKATCSGTWIHNRMSPNPMVDPGTISGPGLLEIVVLPDHVTPGAGTFQIVVACPAPKTATSPSSPGQLGGGQVNIGGHELPSIPNLAVLSGTRTIPHEATDTVNGVTGTSTVTWHLTTTSKPDAQEARRQDAKTLRR